MPIDPVSMGLTAGMSLLSGFGAAKAAKKQRKLQMASDEFARTWNDNKEWEARNHNEAIADQLAQVKHTQSERSGTSSSVDVDAMMLAADRAGFNPVTWLQAGAMQAYTQTSSFSDMEETGQNAAEVARMKLWTPNTINASQIGKVPDPMEAIGDAGQAAVNYYRQDRAQDLSRDFQSSQLDKQLAAYASRASGSGKAGLPGFGDQPRMTSAGGKTDYSGYSNPDLVKAVSEPQYKPPSFTMLPGAYPRDPSLPDGDTLSAVYGDFGSIPFQGWNLLGHGYYGATGGRNMADDATSAYRFMTDPYGVTGSKAPSFNLLMGRTGDTPNFGTMPAPWLEGYGM